MSLKTTFVGFFFSFFMFVTSDLLRHVFAQRAPPAHQQRHDEHGEYYGVCKLCGEIYAFAIDSIMPSSIPPRNAPGMEPIRRKPRP